MGPTAGRLGEAQVQIRCIGRRQTTTMNLPIGTKGEERVIVTSELASNFLSAEQARVLSTPNLIQLMEITSRNSIKPLLDPGFDSVGTKVNITHLAATPVGMSATFRSEVIAVEDRRVTFRVEAYDEKEKIGEGTH